MPKIQHFWVQGMLHSLPPNLGQEAHKLQLFYSEHKSDTVELIQQVFINSLIWFLF